MDIREQIINEFQCIKKSHYIGTYDLFKSAIGVRYLAKGNIMETSLYQADEILDSSIMDVWMKGVIQSLYYKPNVFGLLLYGEPGVGKTRLLQDMLYDQIYFQQITDNETSDKQSYLYNKLIVDIEFNRFTSTRLSNTEFMCVSREEGWIGAEKRLCSYCGTTNSNKFPISKRIGILNISKINFDLINSIDKLHLWNDIFNKFKI